MNETLTPTITTERVDDVPLLLAQMVRMGLPALLDAHFPPHGNHQGLSLGWQCVVWLAHILSQADHRLTRVRAWADQLHATLASFLPAPLRPTDLTDDRLADSLRILSDDARWAAFEAALTGHVIRVYDLQPTTVRVDSTTASGYWAVTDNGLFQFGHSKDHRPDLPQVKVMLATLDPLGMPVAADVVAGQCADDPLYLPILTRVGACLGRTGLLYVGDSKLGALLIRATIHRLEHAYLCPLGAVQLARADLAALVDTALESVPLERLLSTADHPPCAADLTAIMRPTADGARRWIADATEQTVTRTVTVDGTVVTWDERLLLVRSRAAAAAQTHDLAQRLAQAEAALTDLLVPRRGKVRPTTPEALDAASTAILTRYGVSDLLTVEPSVTAHTRERRAYKDRPAQTVTTYDLDLTVTHDADAWERAVARLGWRVYVTNRPADALSLEQAVQAYRDEYQVERSLGRLKGAPLSLSPVYLQRDDHTTGLIRLLTIGVRVLTVLETAIRTQLAQEQASVAGLYAGQPTRTTTRPTAERVLEAFRHLTLTVVVLPEQIIRQLTPLSALQQRLMALAGLDSAVYTRLTEHSFKPPD